MITRRDPLPGAAPNKRSILYFTQSAGYEHSVVKRAGSALSHSEKLMVDFAGRAGFDVHCTKDGRVFDSSLDAFDVIAFYTSGDHTGKIADGSPPMTPAGKRRLLAAIEQGKGFAGFHAATDSFRPPDAAGPLDPFTAMIGAEFVNHGPQQEASLHIVAPKWPAITKIGMADGIAFFDEWYTFRRFAPDLHVILVQETRYMTGEAYRRPNYPATWIRRHGRGRVFYTSLGHREDIWTNPFFQAIAVEGLAWAAGNFDYEPTPNIAAVTPQADIRSTP